MLVTVSGTMQYGQFIEMRKFSFLLHESRNDFLLLLTCIVSGVRATFDEDGVLVASRFGVL